MPHARHISQPDLAEDPRRVLQAVSRGELVILESPDEPSAAIVDLVDFRLLLGTIYHYVHRRRPDPEAGLAEEELSHLDEQGRFDLVLSRYLEGAISLSRAAEALDIPWVELRRRLHRLGIPIHTAPVDADGVRRDAEMARSILS